MQDLDLSLFFVKHGASLEVQTERQLHQLGVGGGGLVAGRYGVVTKSPGVGRGSGRRLSTGL